MDFKLIFATIIISFLFGLFVLTVLLAYSYFKDRNLFGKVKKDIKKIEKEESLTHKEAVDKYILNIKSKSQGEVNNGRKNKRETTNSGRTTGSIQENGIRETDRTLSQPATNLQQNSSQGDRYDNQRPIRIEDRSPETQSRNKPDNRLPEKQRTKLTRI
jgi:hypothetical protein